MTAKEMFNEVDWDAWYQEFTERKTNGHFCYSSAFEFAHAKGKSRQQRDLILHVIGPKIAGRTPLHDPQAIPQFDWEMTRKSGVWLGPERLCAQLEKITAQTDTLLELRSSAQQFVLPLLAKAAAMMDRIEQEFGGHIFLANLTSRENEARAALYMRMSDHTTQAVIRLQQAYALSLGINVGDLSGTIALKATQAAITEQQNGATTKANRFMGQLIEMTLDKAHALGLPLPDEDWTQVARQAANE